jgi:peptidoglycan/xylan/chitin deacetylase (PgdA/CDA1 family)
MRRGLLIAAAAVLLTATVAARPNGVFGAHRVDASRHTAQLESPVRLTAHLPQLALALADARPPRTPRIVLGVQVTRPVVALTFDLDMTPAMATQVSAGVSWFNQDALSYLQAKHIHATMFMTGMWAELYPGFAREIAHDPNFEIGNHSFSHPAFHLPCYQLGSVSRQAQAQQIAMAQRAISWVAGVTPRYFRFPGGCYDSQALNLVHAAGLIPIQWNVNSIDAFNPYPGQIAAAVLSSVRPGSIVLMHLQGGANAPATGQALRIIVPALQQRGYQFLTLSEMLALGPPIQPTDPREVVEAAAPITASPSLPIGGRPMTRPAVTATPRWCRWLTKPAGRSWVCT